ncbi:hypothetical protein UlMin_031510 [Ulmus minor]
MSTRCLGKNSWPELVGKNGEKAAEIIEEENNLVRAIIVVEGRAVTFDYRCDRVWVWVDKHGNVDRVPKIG